MPGANPFHALVVARAVVAAAAEPPNDTPREAEASPGVASRLQRRRLRRLRALIAPSGTTLSRS
jgi:hypothetical protein